MNGEDLPEGWVVWNDEPGGRAIFVYRPDVFDTQAFPPACLPTLTITPTSPDRPAGERPHGAWYVTCYLEPDVRLRGHDGRFDSREAAIAGARELAERFAIGEIDVRESYQVPRDDYLEKLAELTGRDS